MFADARAYKNRRFTILARAAAGPTGSKSPRLGLIVAKRKIRLAVSRNRIKRLARERFRHHTGRLPAVDLIVMPNSGCAGVDNKEIIAALDELFARLIARQD